MIKRRMIEIDQNKCNGCGLCVDACHEGAIILKDGKAVLQRDDYCDGLGDCLPSCPMKAISFVVREALPYDEEAVKEQMKLKQQLHHGCPGQVSQSIPVVNSEEREMTTSAQPMLHNWPVQIKLAPIQAPIYRQAHLLIAADCSAYAYATFHQDFMKHHVTLIGCPKLDQVQYQEKLGEILRVNEIQSVHVIRMEVPCCKGITLAVQNAVTLSGKPIPLQMTTITLQGEIKKG